jgi:hypothetical protein
VAAGAAGRPGETFTQLLPPLRRTFATFGAQERRQMGERARHGDVHPPSRAAAAAAEGFDTARAEAVLPLVAQLLGVELEAAP